MLTSRFLKGIMSEAYPVIKRQVEDAKIVSGFRDVVAANGGDWSALKALIKAHVEDTLDETGEGKRVRKILDKAENSNAYAGMMGLANMNEFIFSEEHDADGVFPDDESPRKAAEAAGESPAQQVEATIAPAAVEVEGQPSLISTTTDRTVSENVIEAASQGVTGGESAATNSETGKPVEASASAAPVLGAPKPLRPHCQSPYACGGQGKVHCFKCRKAAGLSEAA